MNSFLNIIFISSKYTVYKTYCNTKLNYNILNRNKAIPQKYIQLKSRKKLNNWNRVFFSLLLVGS